MTPAHLSRNSVLAKENISLSCNMFTSSTKTLTIMKKINENISCLISSNHNYYFQHITLDITKNNKNKAQKSMQFAHKFATNLA